MTCHFAREISGMKSIWQHFHQLYFKQLDCPQLTQQPTESLMEFFGRRIAIQNNWLSSSCTASTIPTSCKINFLQVHPDQRQLVTTCSGTTLYEWDLSTGLQRSTFNPPGGSVHHFVLSNDLIAISGSDSVRVYDRAHTNMLYQITGMYSFVHRMKIHNGLLLGGSWDGFVKVFNLSDGSLLSTFSGHNNPIYSLDIDKETRLIVTGSSDRSIKLWNVSENSLLATMRGHSKMINSVRLSPCGSRIFSGSKDCTIRVWDTNRSECVYEYDEHQNSVNCLQFDGRNLLVSGSSDSTLRIWDIRTGKSVSVLQSQAPVTGLEFDESRIVACSDQKLSIFDFSAL